MHIHAIKSVIPERWETFPSIPRKDHGLASLDLFLVFEAYKSLDLAPGPLRWDSWMRLIWQTGVFFLAHQLGSRLGNRGGKMCLRGCCKLHVVQRGRAGESLVFFGLWQGVELRCEMDSTGCWNVAVMLYIFISFMHSVFLVGLWMLSSGAGLFDTGKMWYCGI